MNVLTKITWLVFFLNIVCVSPQLVAHELKATTAQVILRDGQVEVKVYTNTTHLISALQSEQAWLMGDIDEIMPENLTAAELKNYIKKALTQKMELRINKQTLSFARVDVTPIDGTDVHDLAIVFQAKHGFSNIDELALSFPKALGTVHANFVKPQYQLLSPGDTAHITF
ncbi:hypothetical protein [Alteromonas sp. C1M14]|uniref:hypothetical protein n=1 Tax=Alteromonas sp. C1M14 TaxID=2841567 RepID=UPI001C082099|nr:hypothetical protein [Alteromonas sp. C1M14]MBU2978256.1 hypothetical protein [Alteromonas sp. C1M14]